MMQPTPNETRTHTDELVDIREVSVDKNLPKEERIAAFIRQIKNPYRFRCGDFVVNACFAGNGVTLEECLQGILEMSRNVQSENTQNLKSMVIQRSFPKWSVAERRKTAAASDQAAVCACAHSRYFAGGSPSGLRV